jgi:hypothetical protein
VLCFFLKNKKEGSDKKKGERVTLGWVGLCLYLIYHLWFVDSLFRGAGGGEVSGGGTHYM